MAEKKERLTPTHPDWFWLQSPMNELLKERSAPFDAKTARWIADPEEVFIRATVKTDNGATVEVETAKGEVKSLPEAEVLECNPPKFEKEEDMSNLSVLNKACVLHNLRTRYQVLQIYTYSGLFCICINPYKWLMVYTPIMRDFYRNKRRNEAPPHLYAIADGALQFLEMENKNQSSLITGESGAGKTENTKKVLQYYALNCADPNAAKSKAAIAAGGTVGLEEQIVQANPPLEAYGNAKTVRNNNSSRFGKFIRIQFGPNMKIASADIETYLLEKSRITFQLEIERNYHIFYQLMTDAYPAYHPLCGLGAKPDPAAYYFISQGVLTVAGMDDSEEMRATDMAFDTLGFTQPEKEDCYKGTIAIAHLGNAKWRQKGREEQAEPEGMDEVTACATLIGVDPEFFVDTFMKPKLKVGKDFVKKGQNVDQVAFSVSATSKSLFARLFDWIVAKVNDSLDAPNPRKYFIGVLDIAGFEIFELNVLEQLLINYTNERLQQFFNHTMFVQEQEEYKAEGIQWAFIDFGMNLVQTIELIEKKMGILSMLEEECIVPKATDKTYLEKMMNKHLGKHNSFAKPKPPKKGLPEAHFALHHYAGTVGYNVTGWLFKNKDPVNDAVIGMMQGATNAIVSLVFQETGEKKKGASMATISAAHRESLLKLMASLHSTHPHFVRCIIPNEIKKSGHTDAPLVMHQLNCNGVLEGIRICMLGLPNKVPYADFMARYSIVAPKIFADMASDPKGCANKALPSSGLDADDFRTGHTKVMFRAGKLSNLEEIREQALSKIILKMQAHVRKCLVSVTFKEKVAEKKAIFSIQNNIRNYYRCKNWSWYQFYMLVTSEGAKIRKKKEEEERRKMMAEGFDKLKKALDEKVAARMKVQKVNDGLKAKAAVIKEAHAKEAEVSGSIASEIKALDQKAAGAAVALSDLERLISSERNQLTTDLKYAKEVMSQDKVNMAKELADMRDKVSGASGGYQGLKNRAIAAEADKVALKGEIACIGEEIQRLDKAATRLLREKHEMWQSISFNKQCRWMHERYLNAIIEG